MKRIGFLIGGGLCLFFGLFAAVFCWFSFMNMQASNSWPSARGEIAVSELVSMNPLKRKQKKANVRYSYQVDGVTYTGSLIRFADTTGSMESLQAELIAPYPVGKEVDVFYDPKNCTTAVLEPGGGLRGYSLVLPPLILFGIGAAFVFSGFQQKQPRRKKKAAKRMMHRPRNPRKR